MKIEKIKHQQKILTGDKVGDIVISTCSCSKYRNIQIINNKSKKITWINIEKLIELIENK